MKKGALSLILALLLMLVCTASAMAAEQTLINKTNLLPADYVPADLVQVNTNMVAPSGTYLERETAEALWKMADALKLAGAGEIQGTSGYRSYDTQVYLYNRKINYYLSLGYDRTNAEILAGQVVAPPGTSEHQSGYAIDVDSLYYATALNQSFAERSEGIWLAEHCWEYGFILRYPENKTDITGYIFEPWHFRYIGAPHAEYIMKNNICLEEYVELIQTRGALHINDAAGDHFVYICENADAANALPWHTKKYSPFNVGGDAIVVTAEPTVEDLAQYLTKLDKDYVKDLAYRSIRDHRTGWRFSLRSLEKSSYLLATLCLEEMGWDGVLDLTLQAETK